MSNDDGSVEDTKATQTSRVLLMRQNLHILNNFKKSTKKEGIESNDQMYIDNK